MKVDAPQQAINVLKEIIAEQADQPASVRMYFAGAACSGPSFGLALDEKKDSDVSCVVEDIEFIMDMNSGFRVIPEKMKDMQSGCGTCSGCH